MGLWRFISPKQFPVGVSMPTCRLPGLLSLGLKMAHLLDWSLLASSKVLSFLELGLRTCTTPLVKIWWKRRFLSWRLPGRCHVRFRECPPLEIIKVLTRVLLASTFDFFFLTSSILGIPINLVLGFDRSIEHQIPWVGLVVTDLVRMKLHESQCLHKKTSFPPCLRVVPAWCICILYIYMYIYLYIFMDM